jgi:hypothetical protein
LQADTHLAHHGKFKFINYPSTFLKRQNNQRVGIKVTKLSEYNEKYGVKTLKSKDGIVKNNKKPVKNSKIMVQNSTYFIMEEEKPTGSFVILMKKQEKN